MYQVDDQLNAKRFENPEDSESDFSEDEDLEIDIESNIQASISTVPEEDRSTHFLAIRITNPDIVTKAQSVQKDVIDQEEALTDCCMGSGLFHVTLAMLRLDGLEAERELSEKLIEIQPQLRSAVENLKLRLEGLSTFGQRVLYVKVLPEPDESFWYFVR